MDVAALEARARERLPAPAFDYYAGGSDDETTLADNVAAWRRIRLAPRVLRDVSSVSTEVELLGCSLQTPVLVAPWAYQKLAHSDGEVGSAQGAAAAGSLMVVSTLATTSLEEVAAASEGALWFQFYVHRDRELSAELVRRADAAGYRAVVLTVDLPVLGRRRRDEANRFTLPEGMVMANLGEAVPDTEGSGLDEYAATAIDPSLTPDDIAWIQGLTGLPVLVKGVLRTDDAAACVDAGAAGLIVSNHGGRQLDGAVATADALPAVVAAVDGRVPVLVDGGIRGGSDVVKALALGAAAVLVARPVIWGLVVDGAAGVEAVLGELTEETARAMALCGATAIGELDAGLIASSKPTAGDAG